jgi:hypothetical protein
MPTTSQTLSNPVKSPCLLTTQVFKAIKTTDDAAVLQVDLNNLEAWSSASGLVFNENKCKLQTVTRKIKPVVATYKMKDARLESTKSERDLGV